MKQYISILVKILYTITILISSVQSLDVSNFNQLSNGTHHAVIIAGSHGYGNYRHHADVCHAFKILSENGVPKNNIIVMLYDDVANDPQNPFPGKLFNKPSTKNNPGIDVYANCQKDYTGNQVTAHNFLGVLTGNQTAVPLGMKVLNSTSSDKVFINFVDHGGQGLLAMPYGPFLYQEELQNALNKMHKKKMYKELVFYVEACESGSMFTQFPKNLNIYVTTAADATQPSYGTYCPPNDIVFYNNQSQHIGSCLGDLYSISWMQNTDKMRINHELKSETLEEQYNIVKKETNLSNVQQFGTNSITSNPIGDFEGNDNINSLQKITTGSNALKLDNKISVNQWDASFYGIFYAYMNTNKSKLRSIITKRLLSMIKGREQIDSFFSDIHMKYNYSNFKNISKCQKQFNMALRSSSCGHNNDGTITTTMEYALKYSTDIRKICAVENGIFSKNLVNKVNTLVC